MSKGMHYWKGIPEIGECWAVQAVSLVTYFDVVTHGEGLAVRGLLTWSRPHSNVASLRTPQF